MYFITGQYSQYLSLTFTFTLGLYLLTFWTYRHVLVI